MQKKQTKKTEKKEVKREKLSQTDFEKRVVELAQKGMTSEKIGETLRKEGIHPKEHEKKISVILKEKGMYVNPDTKNVSAKLDNLRVHFEKNKQDKRSKREVGRVASQLRKLRIYFKEI